MSVGRVLVLALAAVGAAALWKEYPAVIRYLKIARM
jgi:hypothetical protein